MPLGHRPQHVQRLRRNLARHGFLRQGEGADLRPVAVHDHQPPASDQQGQRVPGDFPCPLHLLADRSEAGGPGERNRRSFRIAAAEPEAVHVPLAVVDQVAEIDAARDLFHPAGFESASAQFASVLLGHQRMQRQVMLRAGDTENTTRVVVYRDPGAPIAYRIQWHGAAGTREDGLALLTGTYLFLTPPGSVPVAPAPAPTPGGTD